MITWPRKKKERKKEEKEKRKKEMEKRKEEEEERKKERKKEKATKEKKRKQQSNQEMDRLTASSDMSASSAPCATGDELSCCVGLTVPVKMTSLEHLEVGL